MDLSIVKVKEWLRPKLKSFYKSLLPKFKSFYKRLIIQIKELDKETKKLLLAVVCILVGGSLPLPGEIKAGLVLGGLFLFLKVIEPSTKKKRKSSKKKKKVS